MICVTTALQLALTLTLIATVPTMLDLYCNCHGMIGSVGWVQVRDCHFFVKWVKLSLFMKVLSIFQYSFWSYDTTDFSGNVLDPNWLTKNSAKAIVGWKSLRKNTAQYDSWNESLRFVMQYTIRLPTLPRFIWLQWNSKASPTVVRLLANLRH